MSTKKRPWVLQKKQMVETTTGEAPVWMDMEMPKEIQDKIDEGKMSAEVGERWILRQHLGDTYRLCQISVEGTVADVPEPRRRLV